MPVEEAVDQPSVPPFALHEYGGRPAPAAAEAGRGALVLGLATLILAGGKRAACWTRGGRRAVAASDRLHWPVHIFLIFRYRRTSGSDMATSSPRAMLVAARVIPVRYLSVRMA